MDLVRRELRVNPPREPLDSLGAMVRDFKWRFPRERRDTVVTVCQSAPTLANAIRLACDSRKADGKMHNHQVKVRASARAEFAEELLTCHKRIVMLSKSPARLDPFHTMWCIFDSAKPWGVGPLTVYDVAVRVGAWFGSPKMTPQRLYLHTGVRVGIHALCAAMGINDPQSFKGDWAWGYQLPVPFDELTMDETEDFLCTYRTMFGTIDNFKL